MDKIKPIHL